jgi:hypothetical protein
MSSRWKQAVVDDQARKFRASGIIFLRSEARPRAGKPAAATNGDKGSDGVGRISVYQMGGIVAGEVEPRVVKAAPPEEE